MLELVKAGGWLMVPILLCSVIAMAIVAERFWTLQRQRITPGNLVVQVWQLAQSGNLSDDRIRALRKSSPLGRILAAGLQFPGRMRPGVAEGRLSYARLRRGPNTGTKG